MVTVRNKRKLAAIAGEAQEKHSSESQSWNTSAPKPIEEYKTQVSEEKEKKVTEILSQPTSKTDSRILGALSKLESFHLSPEVRTKSGTVPGASRNTAMGNNEQQKDHSQKDLSPEVGSSF